MAVNTEQIEKMLVEGNLESLKAEDRYAYYKKVCESLGLNPLTQPFEYIKLNGKLRLYAKKDATDQLRRIYGVSVDNLTHDYRESLGLYIVTATGSVKDRKDTSTGAVNVKGLTGDNLANAIMKAEAKAKRRLTLSLCGLGMLDETEVETLRSDEPPPDDPEVEKPAPAKVESLYTPEPEQKVVEFNRTAWGQKLRALGVEGAKLKPYMKNKYGVESSKELTPEQMTEIVDGCMKARETSLDALNKFLEV